MLCITHIPLPGNVWGPPKSVCNGKKDTAIQPCGNRIEILQVLFHTYNAGTYAKTHWIKYGTSKPAVVSSTVYTILLPGEQ